MTALSPRTADAETDGMWGLELTVLLVARGCNLMSVSRSFLSARSSIVVDMISITFWLDELPGSS